MSSTTSTTLPGGPPVLSAELVVDKLTFGPRPGLVEQVRALGVEAWVEQQLAPLSLPDAEGLLSGPEYQTLRNSNLQNHEVQDSDGGQDLLFDQLDHATVIRALHSERQLYELMCDFWANHFNIWRRHTWMGFLRTRDNEAVIRANALGRFADLLSASAHSPAMLDYLDNLPNDASTPGGVNQNYARELMELHTLGIVGGEQVYDETDVQAVAQIISGWSIDWEEGPGRYEFKYLPWQHSYSAVSAFGGALSFPARSYGEGYQDGVALLDYLAHHPSTARHICFKLCRRFISDNPPMSLVDSAAQVFLAGDTAIVPVLRHIFASAEFAASGRAKVRRPVEHLLACLRCLDATVPTGPQGNAAGAIHEALEGMGQALFERVSPDGYPDVAPYWISSDGLIQRWAVSGKVARNRLDHWEGTDEVTVNLAALLPDPLPATVAELVATLAVRLANYSIPPDDVTGMCAAIGVVPTAAASTLTASASKLALAVGLLLAHPTFQRR